MSSRYSLPSTIGFDRCNVLEQGGNALGRDHRAAGMTHEESGGATLRTALHFEMDLTEVNLDRN